MTKIKLPKAIRERFRQEGLKHGAEGGRTRAKNLSPGRRKEIAMAAAKARWAKKGGTVQKKRGPAKPRERKKKP